DRVARPQTDARGDLLAEVVRLAPFDLETLDPDGDVERRVLVGRVDVGARARLLRERGPRAERRKRGGVNESRSDRLHGLPPGCFGATHDTAARCAAGTPREAA